MENENKNEKVPHKQTQPEHHHEDKNQKKKIEELESKLKKQEEEIAHLKKSYEELNTKSAGKLKGKGIHHKETASDYR